MTFPSNSIFFIEQRRKSSKLLVDWKNQQLSPSQTRKMHNVIHERLENVFKIANFSRFLTFLKISRPEFCPYWNFTFQNWICLSLLVLLKWQGGWVEDLKFDAATEHNGCKWTENFNFQQFTTTAGALHLTPTLPTRGVAKSTKKSLSKGKTLQECETALTSQDKKKSFVFYLLIFFYCLYFWLLDFLYFCLFVILSFCRFIFLYIYHSDQMSEGS